MSSKNYVKSNISYNKSLNSLVWTKDSLNPELRLRLLKIAKIFVDYLEIPNFKINDIVLTGSMANFNYTKYSDFDVHIVTRYSDLECDDLAEALYQAKKKIWNDAHDIKIFGHDVELYIEDVNDPPVSAGVYSLLNDQWITKPEYKSPAIDKKSINAKVDDLIKQIDKSIKTADDPEDINRLKTKIRQMRKSGLTMGGEFSVENLSFKVLRNLGYIDKLHNAYLRQQDSELSLNEESDLSAKKIAEILNKYYNKFGLSIKISKHFMDRLYDERNDPPITQSELADFFAKLIKKQHYILSKMKAEDSVVVYDKSLNLSVPLLKTETGLIAITIMRGAMRRRASSELVI